MAKYYLKINAEFTVNELKIAATKVAEKLNEITPFAATRSISLAMMIEDSSIGFYIGQAERVAGSIVATASGKTVDVRCHGVFEVNPRPQYLTAFLDSRTIWRILGITYKTEDGDRRAPIDKVISGLTQETESSYNEYLKETLTQTHFRAVVQTAKRLTDLA